MSNRQQFVEAGVVTGTAIALSGPDPLLSSSKAEARPWARL